MTGTPETRKRLREDCEACDSMPLSKRINNLHINNNTDFVMNCLNGDSSQSSNHHNIPDLGNLNTNPHSHLCEGTIGNNNAHSGMQSQFDLNVNNEQHHYSPELDKQQNPYYYNKNKLLFDLHLERLKRLQN